MNPIATWPRPALVTAGLLLLLALVGWGFAWGRGSQLAEAQRVLTAERQAQGELAVVTQNLDRARAELAQSEARSTQLTAAAAEAEQRLAGLRSETGQQEARQLRAQQAAAAAEAEFRATQDRLTELRSGFQAAEVRLT
ncbi:MAG TPA: hypothetical protein VE033_09960, partial [Acetobacteraceae bacterium]|nr:hypothetical protein [Acetobacteraceae bacterium]